MIKVNKQKIEIIFNCIKKLYKSTLFQFKK